MEEYLIAFTVLLTASFLFSDIFHRLGYPAVIGQILAGVLLGSSVGAEILFSGFGFAQALDMGEPVAIMVEVLSGLGIIFLLLLVGLEIDYKNLRGVGKDAALIAFFSALLPFVFGSLLMLFLGYSLSIALIVGSCLSITAEGTKVMVLMEIGKLNTRVGQIMIGAGVMDDVFEFLFLSIILLAVSGDQGPTGLGAVLIESIPSLGGASESLGALFYIATLTSELLLFVFLTYILFSIFPNIIAPIRKENSDLNELVAVIIFGLIIAVISEILGLGTIIGALIAGIIIQASIQDRSEKQRLVENIKVVGLGIIVPFFFIYMGLYFDVKAIELYPLLFLLVTAAAMAGKILGTVIIKPLTTLSWKQLYLIGWGMNSRGVMELVIASVALPIFIEESALEVFSVIVCMAIFTTLLFPVVLKRTIRNNPQIMD